MAYLTKEQRSRLLKILGGLAITGVAVFLLVFFAKVMQHKKAAAETPAPVTWNVELTIPPTVNREAEAALVLETRRAVMNDQLKQWYDEWNVVYFDGQLPTNVRIASSPIVEDMDEALGETFHSDEPGNIIILIDEKYLSSSKIFRMILLHEMVHVELGPDSWDHGKEFTAEIHRLILAGAYDNIL